MKAMRFYVGVFLITASVLMLQVIQTRILSVVLWYYMAFLVISLAMFGITAGTVWVYLRRHRFSERSLSHDLTYFSSALALSIAVCGALQMSLGSANARTLTGLVVWLELAACLAVPFFFSGVIVSLALTRSPFPIGRVYGVDLAGAALGCLGVLALLNLVDGPTALLWVAAITAAAAVCFAGSGIGIAPAARLPGAKQLLRVKPILAGLVFLALVNGVIPNGFRPAVVKGHIDGADTAPMFTQWNTFSRIALYDMGRAPAQMWGPSPLFKPQDWIVAQHGMNIDGDAATATYAWDRDRAHAAFLKEDVTNIAHFLPGHNRAAVIGVGGGRDMLSAHVFGVPDITGVELNPILARLLTTAPGFAGFSGLGQLPGMHFNVDEGRSWFARSAERFDIIQMSLIDTWAATGAGAFTLSENGLYTVEAWRILLAHLNPSGVFTVSRWYAPDNVNETGRMISLATGTLFDLGETDPSQHIFLAASGHIATLVLSRSPFRPEDVALLNSVAAQKQFQVLLSPGSEPASPVLGHIVASRDTADLQDYTSTLALDLTPPTDERPFFFNQLPLFNPWHAIALSRNKSSTSVTTGNISASVTLLLLFLTSLLLVARTIVYPLRRAIGDVGKRLAVGGTAYFFLIGTGFMSAEIGLLQRMSVFLGHPIYSLSIVLFSLILSTGVGSFLSDRVALTTRTRFVAWAAATALYLVALPYWLPDLLHDFDSATLMVRASLCVFTIAPGGLLMGYGFPTGMRFISAVDRTPTPWFWGINGAAGVLASSFAVAVSIAFGIYVTLFASAACYALLIPAGLAIGFGPATTRATQPA